MLPNAVPGRQDAKWTWQVTESNCLAIDGKPYMPVGVRIQGSPEAVSRISKAGIHDAMVELPANGNGWSETLKALEDAGIRYFIAIDSAGPSAMGYAIEPEGYRIPNLTTSQKIDLALPGVSEALLVLALQRDASIQWSSREAVSQGKLTKQITLDSDLEHVLLIYPHVSDLKMPDYWEALDAHRDLLLSSLKSHKLGPGFRGLINPMGSLVRFPKDDAQFVPSSPLFQMELEAYLRQKYNSVQTALRAWAMQAPDLETFREMSKLVPLWAANRGVSVLWDTSGDRQFPCESRASAAWQDIRATIVAASNRRYQKLIAAIRQVIDVPIVQEWNGWAGPYENSSLGLNGIGARLIGNNTSTMLDSGSRAASTALRWQKPCWLMVSDVRYSSSDDVENTLTDVVRESAGFGARAWFIHADSEAALSAAAKLAAAPLLDPMLSEMRPSAIFYPESAHNPAFSVDLSGRRWWLPTPAAGSRIDLGRQYGAYRYKDGDSTVLALWAIGEPIRTKLRASDPKTLQVLTYDGYDPKARLSKKTLELTVPRTPILIRGTEEIPIPEDALAETVSEFDQFFKEYEKRLPSIAEEKYYYKDNLAAFDRNPGASFLALRSQFQRLNRLVSPTLWFEAELSKDTNFSGALVSPGASNGSALLLKSRIASPPEGYFATYKFSPRVEGSHELWIAAAISEDQAKSLLVRVGDQAFRLPAEVLSPYGIGYAWYRLGEVSLVKGQTELKVLVNSDQGGDLGIDAIVISPKPFHPDGVRQPDAIEYVHAGK